MPRAARFGEISRLPSGRWRARYIGPDGVRYSAPRTFTERRHAEWWLADIEKAISLGSWHRPQRDEEEPSAPAPRLFGEWAQGQITARESRNRKPLKPTTATLYRKLLRLELVPAFGSLEVAEITPAQVEGWHSHSIAKGRRTQTGNAYLLLNSLMNEAVRDGLREANPCRIDGAGKPTPQHQGVVLTPDQLHIYLAAVPQQRRLPLLLMASTGLRVGECLALRRRSIDADTGAVHVTETVTPTKGGHHFGSPKTAAGARTVYAPEVVRLALVDHLEAMVLQDEDALLFPAGNPRKPLNENVLREAHIKGRTAVGRAEMTMHDLRRTCATLAAQNGATVREIMRLLGHTTPQVAMIYQRAEEERMRAIAAAWGHGFERA